MTFTKDLLPDERLLKILAETQEVVTEHNSRCVRGSVEVDARLFESMLVEIQLRRHLMGKSALAGMEAAEKKTVEIPTFDGYVPHVARELQAAFRIACDNAGINVADAAGKGEAS
ncbi:MAG: hypothetical protein LKI85_09225 [Enterobacter sp.]|jgi:hypothetical protein|nr:hypothetical protein [Enterobacter sp.]